MPSTHKDCMIMASRIRKIRHDDETRLKIKAGMIIRKFMDHVEGLIELSATQVSCGKALLDKVLPDLKSQENTGTVTHEYVMRIPEGAFHKEAWDKLHREPAQTIQ
jgi:hypothetical protein